MNSVEIWTRLFDSSFRYTIKHIRFMCMVHIGKSWRPSVLHPPTAITRKIVSKPHFTRPHHEFDVHLKW